MDSVLCLEIELELVYSLLNAAVAGGHIALLLEFGTYFILRQADGQVFDKLEVIFLNFNDIIGLKYIRKWSRDVIFGASS